MKCFLKKIKDKATVLSGTLHMKNFIAITIAGIINATGVTLFLAPVRLYDSGISGTSMLLSQISPLSLSVFLIILNVPLFLYGYKKQGFAFTAYSVYAVGVYSFAAWIITDVLPINVIGSSPLAGGDLLLCAIFGGLISGTGSGLTIRYGGAIDGIEVMAVIFAKALNLSVGTFVMVYNVILYIISAFVTGSWILPLYPVITYYAALKTVDFIVEGIDRSKGVMIVTSFGDEVSDALMAEFDCGTTKIAALGGYSNQDKTLIYFVVNRFQIAKMRNIVTGIDPLAFVTINEVADVFKSSQSNISK
ncbi:MAG: YitT family protein [Eubacteriaceae bacterium]|nr:YitT family protein [Eubacteriaceae bacterium]